MSLVMRDHASLHAAADALAQLAPPRAPMLAELIEVYEITALRMQRTAPVLAAQLREQIARLVDSLRHVSPGK